LGEQYIWYIKDNPMHRRVILIDGRIQTQNVNNIVGFCKNKTHRGIVNKRLLKEHDCINKKCPFLAPFVKYPFWQHQRRTDNKKAKLKKARLTEKQTAADLEETHSEYIAYAEDIARRLGFEAFKVTGILRGSSQYTVFYISDKPSNDWYEHLEIAYALHSKFRKKFLIKHARFPDGSYATFRDIIEDPRLNEKFFGSTEKSEEDSGNENRDIFDETEIFYL